MSTEQAYLDECLLQLKKLKKQAERAIAQVTDEHFFATLDSESNSIALIMKHIAGNMRSRWTDFLTTDGEKPNRNRDSEFEKEPSDTREKIMTAWENSWTLTLATISSLKPEDLGRTVLIRKEPHSVLQAINRQLSHYSAHIGQIVQLAKHYAGANWQTLSVPRKKSKEFNLSKDGEQRT